MWLNDAERLKWFYDDEVFASADKMYFAEVHFGETLSQLFFYLIVYFIYVNLH